MAMPGNMTCEMLDPNAWIRVNKRIAKLIGIEEAILLSVHMEFYHQHNFNWDTKGEKYTVTRKELEEKSFMPERKQKLVEDRLIENGFLIRTSEGLPRRNFYVVVEESIEKLMEEFEESFQTW
jgi:hypothetical protein